MPHPRTPPLARSSQGGAHLSPSHNPLPAFRRSEESSGPANTKHSIISPLFRAIASLAAAVVCAIGAEARAISSQHPPSASPAAAFIVPAVMSTSTAVTAMITPLERHASPLLAGMNEHEVAASASPTVTHADADKYPNWRVHRRSRDGSCSASFSPFCHSKTSDAPTSDAPWSEAAFLDALGLYDRLATCTDSYVAPLIQDALHVLEQAYRLYGPHSVIGSYNGGKDAVVILHLMRAAHAKFHRDRDGGAEVVASKGADGESDGAVDIPSKPTSRPRVIYFEHPDEFPEVLDLLHGTVARFDLDMVTFGEGIKFGEGLQVLVETNYVPDTVTSVADPRPSMPPYPMAFVLGTRTSDPNAGSQGKFAPSSHYMPPFMRVNPILEWSYGHVWHFLRLFQLPYCSLYDQGYTSLGTVKDTLPCPALAKPSVDADTEADGKALDYWPAYMLRDWDQERAGRINSKTGKTKAPTISQSSSTVSLPTGDGGDAVSGSQSGDVAAAEEPSTNNGGDDDDDSSLGSAQRQRTVGLVVIGDEILKGLTSDTNTRVAAAALHEHNVPLARVVVVSDDRDQIVQEIQTMREEVDVIVTSGGVGPTHDDVTMKSVAAALGREMELHREMAKFLSEKMNEGGDDDSGLDDNGGRQQQENELTEAQIKMATLPSGSRLRYLTKEKGEWPVLQCGPVFVLPGVPQFFEKKICALASYLSSELERSVTYRVVLSIDETSIVDILNRVVQRHPNVSFGSYPFVGHPETKTVFTLEGRLIEGGYTRNSGRFLERTKSASVLSSSGTFAAAPWGGVPVSSTSVVPPAPLLFTKDEMDINVKKALSDLLGGLPEGSVLRVDNNDDLSFD